MKYARSSQLKWLLLVVAATSCLVQVATAGQGCPFDDGSCQEYCNQQGCNMGYCGHFAWIQCICRKCGDEWSWYDKVRYNPDKTVNQTELDSLKLNGTTPIILTSSSQAGQPTDAKTTSKPSSVPSGEQQQQQQQKVAANKPQATLTTLLIPDLSDNSRLSDLNDVPDENSDKFLDYLAKNHEKLVQATSARNSNRQQQQQSGDDESSDESTTEDTTTASTSDQDETVEIQISSSNNNTSGGDTAQPAEQQQQQPGDQQSRPITRLFRMAVVERNSDEID